MAPRPLTWPASGPDSPLAEEGAQNHGCKGTLEEEEAPKGCRQDQEQSQKGRDPQTLAGTPGRAPAIGLLNGWAIPYPVVQGRGKGLMAEGLPQARGRGYLQCVAATRTACCPARSGSPDGDSHVASLMASRIPTRGIPVKSSSLGFRTWACCVALVLLAVIPLRLTCSPRSSTRAAAKPQTRPADPAHVLLVPEEDQYLLAILAPVAAKLTGKAGPALVLVVGSPPAEEALTLLDRLNPSRSLFIQSSAVRRADLRRAGPRNGDMLVAPDPTQAGIEIARRFWGKAATAVVSDVDDAPGTIFGANLAAHLAVPLLPSIRWDRTHRLSRALAELGTTEVLVVASKPGPQAQWKEILRRDVRVLSPGDVQDRLIKKIGPDQVRNVIVARAPNDTGTTDPSAWLAPYLSFVRRAPVVLCHSSNAWEAELRVRQLARTHGLKPQTVTILADYESIGVSLVRDGGLLGPYEVEIEPCSGPGEGGAAAFGVGRIPFGRLSSASLLVARGIARERLLAGTPRRVLLVANPNAAYGPLPLAETIARLTAEELKNFGLAVDEFYGKAPDENAVVRAAANASVILFEGHITDLHIFRNPNDGVRPAEEVLPQAEVPFETDVSPQATDSVGWIGTAPETCEIASRPGLAAPAASQSHTADKASQVDGLAEPDGADDPDGDRPGPFGPEEPAKPAAAKLDLAGLPLVVLQSCHSLEEGRAAVVFRSGGIGLVGSVTGIHSASGSAFMKAYFDNVLYRGATVGEALRDARNYFLCLGRLKAARGHKEQAKAYRAALSFRLWGDPEVQVLPGAARNCTLPPITARFRGEDTVSVSIPRRRLPPGRTDKYAARIFPGSQLAGIVKRLKSQTHRRLMPTYFFRLSVPKAFAERKYRTLQRDGDTGTRAAFITDPLGRYVYVLYLPGKEKARERFTLRFGR